MWETYLQPTTLEEALNLLHQHGGQARLVSGGTDVMVELQRGVRPTSTLIDITKLRDLKYVREQNGMIHLGALATHNDVIASAACVERALPLAQACWEVGAPQIRTRATIAGNLVTASPANDTITPMMALGAEVVLASDEGERVVPLRDFYAGFRRTVLQPNELLREVRFPALRSNQRGLFLKLGLRRAQAISVINIAFVLTFEDDQVTSTVSDAQTTLGCLAPTIVHASTVEEFLRGKQLDPGVCAEAGRLASNDVMPIDDVRGTAAYRLATLSNLVTDGLGRIAAGREREGWPQQPVLLATGVRGQELGVGDRERVARGSRNVELETIHTQINGKPYELTGAHTTSLLNALRDNAGLTGTKEGCAEGECGACTVWLDGQAVMACLVPAAQAHGASITTIEGLSSMNGHDSQTLHPLQRAFIDHAAVQCGYCIPGFLMAGSKLLEEIEHPDLPQAQIALSGNICRCTGYRKILDAVLSAGGAA